MSSEMKRLLVWLYEQRDQMQRMEEVCRAYGYQATAASYRGSIQTINMTIQHITDRSKP